MKKFFFINKKVKGTTLIEIIIAITILSIISVTFLSVFSSGYIGILSGGKHTDVAYEGQKQMEDIFVNPTKPGETGVVTGEDLDYDIEISFPDTGTTIVSNGKYITKDVSLVNDSVIDSKHKVNIITFIPK